MRTFVLIVVVPQVRHHGHLSRKQVAHGVVGVLAGSRREEEEEEEVEEEEEKEEKKKKKEEEEEEEEGGERGERGKEEGEEGNDKCMNVKGVYILQKYFEYIIRRGAGKLDMTDERQRTGGTCMHVDYGSSFKPREDEYVM